MASKMEVEWHEEQLTGGVDSDMVTEAGGVEGFAVGCLEGGCCCEPCGLCERGDDHEVGHECADYRCLGCEAKDYLDALQAYRTAS